MTNAPKIKSPPVEEKLPPENMAIRGRPPRGIRFRREIIVGAAGLGTLSILAIAGFALQPRLFEAGPPESAAAHYAQPAPEAISELPEDYGKVHKLGPKLPGDLGRPILAYQRSLEEGASLVPPPPAAGAEDRTAVTAREQHIADLRAARQSSIMFGSGQPRGAVSSPGDALPVSAVPQVERPINLEADPNAQTRKLDFVRDVDQRGDLNPHLLKPAPSPNVIMAGSVISASLITGLRSDLPGLVAAQVTENVYDSVSGRILLIPQGARLIGQYDSVVAFGQKRALVVWQRIIMSDGSSLRIDNVPATDASGYAGLADKVDFHTWQLLKGVALSTLLGVSSQLALSEQGDLVQAIRMSTQNNVSRAGDQFTQQSLNIQPTITVRPGTPVRLVVHKDLVLTFPSKEN